MKVVDLATRPGYDPDRLVVEVVADGEQANVRLIRLSPGQTLPAHSHGVSELALYAVEGRGVLDTDDGPVPLSAGCLATYAGHEELRLSNPGPDGLTLLAFLAPPFPPR